MTSGVTVSVYIAKTLRTRIAAWAKQERRSFSQMAAILIEEGLRGRDRQTQPLAKRTADASLRERHDE